MRTAVGLNLFALGFLTVGLAYLARGLAQGKGTVPKGRDRRIAAALLAVAAALFLAAGGFLMTGDWRSGQHMAPWRPRLGSRTARGGARLKGCCGWRDHVPPTWSRAVGPLAAARRQGSAQRVRRRPGSPTSVHTHGFSGAGALGYFGASTIRSPGTSSATRWATARHHRAVGGSGAPGRSRAGMSASRS